MPTITEIILNGTTYTIGGSGSGLTDDVKSALDQFAQNIGYDDSSGQDYYNALHLALYPPANLSSISAVYTQSGTVYNTDSLETLKSDLVVTAHYDNGTTQTVTGYSLSGTLAAGTSTITVSYGGKTTTFTVSVTADLWINDSLSLDSSKFHRSSITGYSPYYGTSSTRVCYVDLDVSVSAEYAYTINYTTTVTGTTTNIGINYLTETGVERVNNGENLGGGRTDIGWKDNGYIFTPGTTGAVRLWFVFRAGDGSEAITVDNFPTITVTRMRV